MPIFKCLTCSYETSRKSSYDTHNTTKIHLKKVADLLSPPINLLITEEINNEKEIQYPYIEPLDNEYELKYKEL